MLICLLCELEINDGESRVICPPGTAHRKCRDAKIGRPPRVNPNTVGNPELCTPSFGPKEESLD